MGFFRANLRMSPFANLVVSNAYEGRRLLSTEQGALLGIRTGRDIVVPLAMEATDESKKLGGLGA
ncbi:hypothetical protein D3C76_1615760 [compost metagenome]